MIDRSPAEIYALWRNPENLPRFLEHVESVTALDDERSHWVVKGLLGTHVEWTAHTVTNHPNESFAWESLPGAEVQNAGSVRFEPMGSATKVTVKL